MTKKKRLDKRFCANCGDDISHMRSDARYCWKTECRNAYGIEKYHNRLTEKNCEHCGQVFLGKDKEKNCENCRRLRTNINFQKFTQKTICKYCRKILFEVNKNLTRAQINTILSCCRECNSKRHSLSKLGQNNPNWRGGIIKYNKYLTREDMLNSFSIRMKNNNPMYDPSIAIRVGNTLKQKYITGVLSKTFGHNHWLWKGNRKHSFILRTRLNIWHRDVLSRDNYMCQLCGSKKELEVHHQKESFSSIVHRVMDKHGINSLSAVDVNSQLFENIAIDVVRLHTIDNGITYCKKCHSIVDPKRRI